MGGEHDAFIKVIIVERIVKAIVLLALAFGLIFAGRSGLLTAWAEYAQDQLNLSSGHGVIVQLLLRLLAYIGNFAHINVLAVGAIAYAILEGSEGDRTLRAAPRPLAPVERCQYSWSRHKPASPL